VLVKSNSPYKNTPVGCMGKGLSLTQKDRPTGAILARLFHLFRVNRQSI